MPTERPPAQQVEVQVIYCLPTLAVTIDHQAEAALCDPDLLRDEVCHQQEVPQQPIISLGRIEDGREVLPGNNQDVDRRLRVDVFEGDGLLVLIHHLDRTFPACYLTKEAGIHILAFSVLGLILLTVALAQFPSHL